MTDKVAFIKYIQTKGKWIKKGEMTDKNIKATKSFY